jgi:mRNA interferase RelE/StbE
MRYVIEFTASASRELRNLDRPIQRRIAEKIEQLREDPVPPGARKFYGEAGHWRIRVGDYRVIYRIEKRRLIVVVVRVGHRREAYR